MVGAIIDWSRRELCCRWLIEIMFTNTQLLISCVCTRGFYVHTGILIDIDVMNEDGTIMSIIIYIIVIVTVY